MTISWVWGPVDSTLTDDAKGKKDWAIPDPFVFPEDEPPSEVSDNRLA